MQLLTIIKSYRKLFIQKPASKHYLLALLLLISSPNLLLASDTITNKAQGSDFYPAYPTPNYGSSEQQKQLIQRGEYMVKAGDCIACHTNSPGGGKPFAGGLPINTPFGIFYTPNITPDKKTGIGAWTDADFIRAMHEGINPQGQYYFPVFPYTSFTKISDQDLLAIKAYLFSIPAVNQANKKPGAPWPFSWRFAQLGWRIMFFHKGYYQYDNNQTAQWNRGAYLVQGLGHCGECHTPRNLLGAMEDKYYLTGAFIDGYWAPDITSHNFKINTVPEVVGVFDQAELVNQAGPVRGPMSEVDHNSLMNLSQADLDAIAVYLKTVKSVQPRLPKGVQNTKTNLVIGQRVYKKVCAICHDKGVAGAPMIYDTANWTNRLQKGLSVLYLHAINGYNNMPPRGGCVTCTNQDVQNAVDYILVNSQNPATLNQIAGISTPAPSTSVELGKTVYATHCAVCHNEGLLGAPKLSDQQAWSVLLSKNIDTLVMNTISGVGAMPAMGGCKSCSTPDIIAAVKYMAQEANPKGNYSQW